MATFSSASSEDVYKKHGSGGLAKPTTVLPSGSTKNWSEISADVYLELKQAFEMIDTDGNGKIRKEELLCGLGAEPPSNEELWMLAEVDRYGDGWAYRLRRIRNDDEKGITLEEFHVIGSAFAPPACDSELRDNRADTDNSGTIEYGEFLAATLHMNKMEREENLLAAFSFFDKDGSGYITIDELQQACKDFGLGEVKLDEIIKEIDIDNVSVIASYLVGRESETYVDSTN
ncbi:Calcium-dependent protein kinase 11 [Striga hermonthica]|uniref:Calcium-dependent protein kinase 11 n=1 Tax=Striga hermonthica TaxID=68872 RepID=A0A9N7NCC9_STRHE|nr:Calcium-dependent protein kinase 11 [Striga hermonthica]